mmetsp:Transcript_18679/g.44271  ORF Transcript_18679/g.44271 Transcript_18679/m.44271 type:complete len:202 (-) Transcript_18679:1498-2103(-)
MCGDLAVFGRRLGLGLVGTEGTSLAQPAFFFGFASLEELEENKDRKTGKGSAQRVSSGEIRKADLVAGFLCRVPNILRGHIHKDRGLCACSRSKVQELISAVGEKEEGILGKSKFENDPHYHTSHSRCKSSGRTRNLGVEATEKRNNSSGERNVESNNEEITSLIGPSRGNESSNDAKRNCGKACGLQEIVMRDAIAPEMP